MSFEEVMVSDTIQLDVKALDELRALQQETGTDLIKQLLQSYLSTTPGLVEQIRNGYATGDAKAVFMAAHSLKSSSAYVGAAVLSDLAKRLEEHGRADNLASAEPLMKELDVIYPRIVELLEQEMQQA